MDTDEELKRGMSDSNFLQGLGKLSEPVTVFINRVSQGVGGLFRPWQIKRVAKADGEALKIGAQAKADAAFIEEKGERRITELQHRGIARLIVEEGIKQSNMEEIVIKAIPFVEESAKPQDMDNDWIVNFFDKSRLISDDQMQVLWAKILAGEANSPGSYSKRTVNLLGSIDKTDADNFTSLCRFVCFIRSEFIPLVFDISDPIYRDKGVSFNILSHLDDIGLLTFENVTAFRISDLPKELTVSYHGRSFMVEFAGPPINIKYDPQLKREFYTGVVTFTKTGYELYNICGAEPVDGFYDYVKSKFAKTEWVQIIE